MEDKLPDVLQRFLDRYYELQSHYEAISKCAEGICKENLQQRRGIQCYISSRPKDPDKLREKLLKPKYMKGNFENTDAVRDEVPDLAGVRIALYFPKQKATVDKALLEIFEDCEVKDVVGTPSEIEDINPEAYRKWFPGYEAKHYRVLLPKKESDAHKWKIRRRIEIQVVSVLQHAWAEVEHDIIYKSLRGPASQDEHRLLDGLSGLIRMGEFFLEQLQDSQVVRIESFDRRFANQYELGSILFKKIAQSNSGSEMDIGSVEALRKLLKVLNMDTPGSLENALKNLDLNMRPDSPFKEVTAKYKGLGSYEGFKLKPSIYIMDHVLTIRDQDDSAIHQAVETAKDLYKPTPYLYKLSVIISAILWLDELFPPFSNWSQKFSKHGRSPAQSTSMRWLGGVRPSQLLVDTVQVEANDRKTLDTLWAWFDTHPENMIQMVFKISKMGVLRDLPGDLHLLAKIYHSFLSELLRS